MLRYVISFIFCFFVFSVNAVTFNLENEETRIVGHNLVVFSHEEDTLLDIARQFDIGYEEIVTANPDIDPWLPGEGTQVLVPNRYILPDAPHKGIVINLAEMRLYYYPPKKKGQLQQVVTHPIGTGREGWTTPIGKTRIIQKKKDPTWTPPASILKEHLEKGDPLPKVVPAGPENPLGAYAMRLGMPGYLLHGTNRPFGVGMRVSHGCIRLFPEDIEHLFGMVIVNTPVEILYQPYKAALHNDKLYIEVHEQQEDLSKQQGNSMTGMVTAIVAAQETTLADEYWSHAETAVREHRGTVKRIDKLETDLTQDVWFVHTGLSMEGKEKLAQASTGLNLNDYFWPIKSSAEGEVVLGPFNNHEEAGQIALKLSQWMGISVWSSLLSDDSQ